MTSGTRGTAWNIAAVLAIASGSFAAFVAVRYANQLPLDHYSFRQTQTALTAYWLAKNGFALAYETPVVGPPWSIPFEFPIYQWIVAVLSTRTGAPLDATGRLVSFGFLVGCLFPVAKIVRRLALPPIVFPTFCALLLSAPTYVYWGRTFMIETAALFFCVVAIRWFVDLLLRIDERRAMVLFTLFMSIGILQKGTTGAPVLLVLAAVFVVDRMRAPRLRELAVAAGCFGIPLAVGIAWAAYTDRVKLLNPFAATALTTTALRGWNFGTVAQRLSPDLFRDVVWKEILAKNCGGIAGIALLVAGLFVRSRARPIVVASLALGIVPLFVFTNLHIEHSYYQAANVVFFLFAIAVVLGCALPERIASTWLPSAMTVALVAGNVAGFVSEYGDWVSHEFTVANSKELALASIIRNGVPPDHTFVAFDLEWTSSLAYLSQRKGFMVADVFKDYDAMRRDPSKFVDAARLGAVVACPTERARLDEFVAWADVRGWTVTAVADCRIALPGQRPR